QNWEIMLQRRILRMSVKQTNIYWSKCEWKEITFLLAATVQGLSYVSSPHAHFNELEQWVQKKIPNPILSNTPDNSYKASNQIRDYLDEKQTDFSLPLDIIGTPFQKKVWQAMCKIPYGEKATYGEIANDIGNKKAVRAVGTAIGANPLMIILPCHRVVAKTGALTGFRGGIEMKEMLLRLEEEHHIEMKESHNKS